MFGRPKAEENEEEILSMQEAYLREKETNKDLTPAAQVVSVGKHKPSEAAAAAASNYKLSQFAKNKGLSKKSRVTFDEGNPACEAAAHQESDAEDDCVYYPDMKPTVLGSVTERTFYDCPGDQLPSTSGINRNALGRISSPRDSDPYCSTEMKAPSDEDVLNMTIESKEEASYHGDDMGLAKSAILQGELATEIHEQNVQTISGMSSEEIATERQRLLESIDPDILEYVVSLRNSSSTRAEAESTSAPPVQGVQGGADVRKRVLHLAADGNKWLHFDTFEVDKLEWTQDLEGLQSNPSGEEPYEARFDFTGYLQPYSGHFSEETRTLYHHGEEPHRPGYSLNELFQLCRSSISQQRVLAVNTIAGILEYHSMGIYYNVLDIPITKIYFVLRLTLDGNVPNLIEPTLTAMRNLFYCKIDEACLDLLLCTEGGLIQPRLISAKTENSQTDTEFSQMKDFHLVDLDLVQGAIRTNLVARLKYILAITKPSHTSVECIIQILTRLFRDTPENAEKVFESEGLMEFIFENHLPKYLGGPCDRGHCKIILFTIKMVRVAVGQSRDIAQACCFKHDIFKTLLSYIGTTLSTDNTLLLKIQVEVFYLWASFVHYGMGMDALVEMKGLLLRLLDSHAHTTELAFSHNVLVHSHFAALVTLLTQGVLYQHKSPDALPPSYFDQVIPIMMFAFKKWANQIGSLMSYTAGHLKSVSALLTFVSAYYSIHLEKLHESLNAEMSSLLHQMVHCDGFRVVASSLGRTSNLLSRVRGESCTKQLSESSLPRLCASLMSQAGDVLPIVRVPSPICFLVALSKCILVTKNKPLCSGFLMHNIVMEYAKQISATQSFNFTDNWFTKIEIDFLCNLIYLAMHLQVSDVIKEIIYQLAFKLSYTLTAYHKRALGVILRDVVFNKRWVSAERILRRLSLSEGDGDGDTDGLLNHLPSMFQCYARVLDLDVAEATLTLSVANWNQQVLPRDWGYMPIVGVYSAQQRLGGHKIPKELEAAKEDRIKEVMVHSLRWFLITELYYQDISNEISLADRFCRLCCVYLCDNSLFLDPDVRVLLGKCFQIIFRLENSPVNLNKLNFDRPVTGISSFEDFYTKLIDQFQAVSYGDPLFAACVLVPLAQKHHIKWRKLIWSEYASCLRALDCPTQHLCYPIEMYLEPPERDFSLLKCYHHAVALNLVRPQTTVYRIAKSHIDCAKSRQKLEKFSQ